VTARSVEDDDLASDDVAATQGLRPAWREAAADHARLPSSAAEFLRLVEPPASPAAGAPLRPAPVDVLVLRLSDHRRRFTSLDSCGEFFRRRAAALPTELRGRLAPARCAVRAERKFVPSSTTVLSLSPWQTAGDAALELVWGSYGDDVAMVEHRM
jgi:hypothetical protein